MSLTYGELFAGYDGLGLGVRSVLGGETAWFAEYDKAPSRILAHHYPGVPNIGDVTTADWASLPPVDVITGGSPCQDLSHAGKRKGMTDGTRSNLWVAMREAVAVIRPRLVVWENVRGAYSAAADSDVEHCPGCMGDPRHTGPALRALGRVLGDLADLGYDARWYGLRAADVGAPHGRFRVFLFAVPSDSAGHPWRLVDGDGAAPADAVSGLGGLGRLDACGRNAHGRGRADGPRTPGEPAAPERLALLPTPDAYSADRGGSQHPDKRRAGGHQPTIADVAENVLLPTPKARDHKDHRIEAAKHRPDAVDSLNRAIAHLLPTPAVNDMGAAYTPETWDAWTARMKDAHGNGNGHGKSLAIEAQRLLPTPSASQAGGTAEAHRERKRRSMGRTDPTCTDLGLLVAEVQAWGDYAPAIARWEAILGRPSPAPTETGPKGTPRLSPAFTEWMMGLPPGWVTDPAIGISRNDQLKACGNGVVPQQAAAATAAFVHDTAEEAAA